MTKCFGTFPALVFSSAYVFNRAPKHAARAPLAKAERVFNAHVLLPGIFVHFAWDKAKQPCPAAGIAEFHARRDGGLASFGGLGCAWIKNGRSGDGLQRRWRGNQAQKIGHGHELNITPFGAGPRESLRHVKFSPTGAEPLFFLDYLACLRCVSPCAVEQLGREFRAPATRPDARLIGGKMANGGVPGFLRARGYDMAGIHRWVWVSAPT